MSKFYDEIMEQPSTLRKVLEYFQDEGSELVTFLKRKMLDRGINYIIFTGMGSSLFCCYVPYYYLNSNGIMCEVRDTSEFLYNSFPSKLRPESMTSRENVLVFCVSQSGESAEIVKLLEKLKGLKAHPLIVGITNQPNSTLYKQSDMCFLLNAGSETSVTSKSYTSSILLLYLIMQALFGENQISTREFKEVESLIEEIELFYKIFCEECDEINNILAFLGEEVKFLEFIARGPSLATANQAALNFKEIVKEKSEALTAGLFRHGSIEMLDEDFKVVFLSSNSNDSTLNSQLISNLLNKWSVGRIIHITNQSTSEKNTDRLYLFNHQISNSYLAPIIEIVILQMIMYNLAQKKGLNPGEFKYSSKITREG